MTNQLFSAPPGTPPPKACVLLTTALVLAAACLQAAPTRQSRSYKKSQLERIEANRKAIADRNAEESEKAKKAPDKTARTGKAGTQKTNKIRAAQEKSTASGARATTTKKPKPSARATSPKAKAKPWFMFGSQQASSDPSLTVRTTAYTHNEKDHYRYGRKNAIGTQLKYGKVRSAAADWSFLPLGTKFRIEGDPSTYVIDDYGSALVGNKTIDIYKPSRRLMNKWGVRHVKIHIVESGSRERSLKMLSERMKWRHVREMVSRLKADSKKPAKSALRLFAFESKSSKHRGLDRPR